MLETRDTTTEIEDKATQPLDDPFAVDFFGSAIGHAETEAQIAGQDIPSESNQALARDEKAGKKGQAWFSRLPRYSRREAFYSNSLKAMPSEVSEKVLDRINGCLSHFILGSRQKAVSEVVDIEEVNIRNTAKTAEEEQSLFISFVAEPDKAPALLIVDSIVATELVNKTLGGPGLDLTVRRKLSRTETTVAEFLTACIAAEFNELIGEPLLRISSINQEIPSWAGGEKESRHDASFEDRGLSLAVKIRVDDCSGVLRLVCSDRFLLALDQHDSPLLKKYSATGDFAAFKKTLPELSTQLVVGEIKASAKEIGSLEEGDFIFIDRTGIDWDLSILGGSARMQLGDLHSNWASLELGAGPDGKLVGAITGISIDISDKQELERMKMENDESGQDSGEDQEQSAAETNVALESIVLNVNVVVGGRKMSLEEISRLRAGQILELGCRATDPVDLVSEGRKLATGDLIDLEGNLGIRLTKVFV